MATELGQAYIQIMPSAKGISGAIQKELDPESQSAGKSAGGKIAGAIKGVIAAAAIGKFIGASLTAGGDLQQSLGGIETLFKDNADKVKQYANEAYKTAGLSANDYMESVTSFSASLLQSLGGDTEAAAEKANTALIDMSDNANKMGTDMESIQNAYQGFAKQNYTMLDNLKLGYGGTKSEMERLLSDATKLSGVKYDINNLADVYDAIHVIQTELDITGTTAKESAETFSGSLASMKSAFANVMGNLALGQDLTPHLKALAKTVSTFLFGNFIPMIGNILIALPGAIITFIRESIPEIKTGLENLLKSIGGSFSENFTDYLDGDGIYSAIVWTLDDGLSAITEKAPEFLKKGVEILTNISNGILQEIPFFLRGIAGLLDVAINFLMENFPTFMRAGADLILNLVDGIIENLPAIADGAIQAVSSFLDTVIQNYPEYFKTGWGIIVELAKGIFERLPAIVSIAVMIILKFIGMLLSKLPDIFVAGGKILMSIVSGIGSVVSNLYGKGIEIMQGLWDKIDAWKDRFFNAGKNIVNSIADGIKSAVGTVTNAIGGVVQSVRDFLPFSPAKRGPLSDLNKLDFTIIADGIYKAKNPITKAMEDLARSTLDSYDAITDIKSKITYKASVNKQDDQGKINPGGNTYIFNSPKALTPAESRRQMKKTQRETLLGF